MEGGLLTLLHEARDDFEVDDGNEGEYWDENQEVDLRR